MSFALETDLPLNLEVLRKTRRLTRIAFAMGAVSAVSWWTAFLIAMLKGLMTLVPFYTLLAAYFSVMLLAICVSLIMEIQYVKRGQATGRLTRKWTATQEDLPQ